jgi:glucose/arabinose dehydrogenase
VIGVLKRVSLVGILLLSACLLLTILQAKPAAAAVPPGFVDEVVASSPNPTALAFAPDGRLLIAERPGRLWVYEDGQLLTAPALDISSNVCSNSERGLLGVAVDPGFGTPGNNYVYLYYTAKVGATCDGSRDDVNRVSRFTMSGDTLDPASETKLIDNIPSTAGNHNAGDLHFGKDGFLYVSVGDGGCDYASPNNCQYNNDAARDRHILLGKILRITRDGGIPPDNPFTGTNSARCNVGGRTTPDKICQETFAMGLRNPFRMAFDPDVAGTRFFINDVGGASWEEIDLGTPGADYGWNLCEGTHDNPHRTGSPNCSAAPLTPPIYQYSHSGGCSSITGGAFVPNGAWPSGYDNAYLYGDYVCGKIFAIAPGGGFEFANGLGPGGPIHMTFSPHRGGQSLYYTTFAGGGQVHRISHSADYPTANVASDPPYGDADPTASGSTIEFDASGSRDPQGGPLTYIWDFGDETTDETTTDPTIPHTYTTTGKYTVKLTVRDDQGLEDTAEITVWPGNTPPEPEILNPAQGTRFAVGQRITLQGTATDAEDSADPELRWEVRRYHNGNHFHPYFLATGADASFSAPPPEELSATNPNGNYLEVRLTATDSLGLSSETVTRRLNPRTVALSFATRPGKLRLIVNGSSFRAPRTLLSWEGYALNVTAPTPQKYRGKRYAFRSWSDGGGSRHTITTPANPKTYIANFRRLRR